MIFNSILCTMRILLKSSFFNKLDWIEFMNHRGKNKSLVRVTVRTGTFILNSSLLNLKRMSESVRCRRVVGLRTRTSWRFPGKEPWNERVDGKCHLGNGADSILLRPESIIHHTSARHVLFFLLTACAFCILFPAFVCLSASHVKTLAQTRSSMCVECVEYKRMGKMWGM